MTKASHTKRPEPRQRFDAFYEDWSKAVAAATKRGYRGPDSDDEVADFVEIHDYITSQIFETQDAAVAWIVQAIKSGVTSYGAGQINAEEKQKRRCRYCVCDGWQTIKRVYVSADGVDGEDSDFNSNCLDED